MSARSESPRAHASGVEDERGQAPGATPQEHRDALPVLAPQAVAPRGRSRELALASGAPSLLPPMLQAAAAAAGGFLAGAAVAGIVHRRHARATPARLRRRVRLAQAGGRSPARSGELVQIVGSRSLLVDVHLLGER